MDIKLKWNEEKNELLKATRKVSFEMLEQEIKEGRFIGPEYNKAHPNQHIIIVSLNSYPCVVPFVIEDRVHNKTYDMKYKVGFVGCDQNDKKEVSPVQGWIVSPSTKEDRKSIL